jgi:hypothetical protein
MPTYVIFKKLPEVNNCPKGEHSPNLVTLSECMTDVILGKGVLREITFSGRTLAQLQAGPIVVYICTYAHV